jgi:hypothetical protein
MQPLYFFNVKASKVSDSQSSLGDRRLALKKEAQTPCFIGSPVNSGKLATAIEATSFHSIKSRSSQQRYHSFGSEHPMD